MDSFDCLYYTTQSSLLKSPRRKAFENIVGKGENAGNQHFLLFQQCFLLFPIKNSIFLDTFILLSANAFNLDWSKILLFGKELILEEDQNTGSFVGTFCPERSQCLFCGSALAAMATFNYLVKSCQSPEHFEMNERS